MASRYTSSPSLTVSGTVVAEDGGTVVVEENGGTVVVEENGGTVVVEENGGTVVVEEDGGSTVEDGGEFAADSNSWNAIFKQEFM